MEVDLEKMLQDTRLDEDEVFSALSLPHIQKYIRRMDGPHGLLHSKAAHDLAVDNREDSEIIKQLDEMHESRCMAVLNGKYTIDSICDMVVNARIDGPAYTLGVQKLLRCFNSYRGLSNVCGYLKKSANKKLLAIAERKLAKACWREFRKPNLTLREIGALRSYASDLPDVRYFTLLLEINERYSSLFQEFLSQRHTLDELNQSRGYARGVEEFMLIDKLIGEAIFKECNDNESIDTAYKLCREHPSMPLDIRIKCMAALAARSQCFSDLWNIFYNITRGDYERKCRAKMLDKLVELANTKEDLVLVYKQTELSSQAADLRKKIIQKIAKFYQKE